MKRNMIAAVVLAVGVTMLILGIITGCTVGTVVTPTLIICSIVVNTVGITLLRHNKK